VLEVGALVLRAGRAAELTVRTEISVVAVNVLGNSQRGEIDCGWYCPRTDRLIVAWEFDGRDAKDGHLLGAVKVDNTGNRKATLGNAQKFRACNAAMKVQVFYGLKNDLTSKPAARPPLDSSAFGGVVCVTDEELMSHGPRSIECFVNEARVLAGKLPFPT
jgi:hypothetical protein